MKILIIDIGGCGLDLAIRFQWAGHDVKLYYKPMKYVNVGRGLVSRVNAWQDWMKWADLILMTDLNCYKEELEYYFEQGYPIMGTNKASAELELDRVWGQEILKKCGMQTLPYKKFENCDDAIAHVLAAGDGARFVSKPCGNGATALSYASKGPNDMIFMLERWKKKGSLKTPFILQEFCQGIEMGVGGWFGPHGFNSIYEENFEHKKLMNDNVGMNTGEMGTALKYCQESNLAELILKPCEDVLSALKFVGNVDLNVMINKDGVWPMEWTMRFGWPAAMIQLSLHLGDPADWLLDLVNGKDSQRARFDHAIGVVVAIPDFPYSNLTGAEIENVPIYGINTTNVADIHFNEVMVGEAPFVRDGKIEREAIFVSAGDSLLTVVGRGTSVSKAHDKAYNTIKNELEIPNSPLYRTDIGNRLEEQLPELQKLGFAESWIY